MAGVGNRRRSARIAARTRGLEPPPAAGLLVSASSFSSLDFSGPADETGIDDHHNRPPLQPAIPQLPMRAPKTASDEVATCTQREAMADPFTPPAGINHALLPILGPTPRHPLDTDDDTFVESEAPNPWQFLSHYKRPYWNINDAAATKYTKPLALQTFPLANLPVEVIYYLAKELPPESAACLALVNKTFYGILGPRVLDVCRPHLWRLLILLEKDMTFFIACPSCLKLHSPFTNWIDFSDEAPCRQFDHPPFNPFNVRYSLVRAIAKTHLQNGNYSEILTALNSRRETFGDHRQTSEVIQCRIVQGSLLVQTQTIVSPRRANEVTMRSLWELNQLLASAANTFCQHKNWKENGPVLGVHDINKLVDQHDDAHHETYSEFVKARHTAKCCSVKDVPKVFSTEELKKFVSGSLLSILFHKEKHGSFGKLQGCEDCCTDYSVTFVDIETAGRCIVFTTWKDFGGIGPQQAQKWETHRERWDEDEDDMGSDWMALDRSSFDFGSIYCAWEGLDHDSFDRRTHTYEPQLPQRVIDGLKKKAEEVAEAAAAKDKNKPQ